MNLCSKFTFRALLCVAAACAAASTQAQIGTGWTSYSASRSRDLDGSGAYSSANGVETFTIGSSTSGVQRAENKINNTFSSGQRQFEGRVRVASLGGTNICLKQTFKAPNVGPLLMLSVRSASGGTLYDHGNTGAGGFRSGVVGETVRVNSIHNTGTDRLQLYLNGGLVETRDTGTHASWFNKYGCYRTQSGRGPATVQWSSIRLWRK